MKKLRIALLLTLVTVLLLTSGALAMQSANYRLDWFVPLTGGGSIGAESDNYTASFTYGQSATNILLGGTDNYLLNMGFWAGNPETPLWIVNLPMLIKK